MYEYLTLADRNSLRDLTANNYAETFLWDDRQTIISAFNNLFL